MGCWGSNSIGCVKGKCPIYSAITLALSLAFVSGKSDKEILLVDVVGSVAAQHSLYPFASNQEGVSSSLEKFGRKEA